MNVDITESGQAKVTMKGYIEDVLEEAGLPGTARTPATEGLYVIRESAPKVTEHADGKAHTGSCVVIGDVGAVHCRSVKQQIVSKSSTEAELIGLSDSANQGLFVRTFLLAQGYSTVGPVTIYQDNMSCMALLRRGKSGSERTRHIAIRYFWVKERVVINEVVIEHKGTKEMYANVLTKPLQGAQFVYERECLTGWSTGEDIEYE